MRLHHLRQELLVLHRAATPVIEVLDERLDEAAECAWHAECNVFQRRLAKFDTRTSWTTETRPANPSQRKRFPISSMWLRSRQKWLTDFVNTNHYGNHGTLFTPFRMVRSAWCFPSRTCTARRNLRRCIWKFRGRGSSMNQWTSSRNPLGGNQALNPASPSIWSEHAEAQQASFVAHGKDHLPEHLHGPLSKRTMGGIRRKSLCRKTRSTELPACSSCPLHFGEPLTNKWTWMLQSSAICTSSTSRTTSITEQYNRTRTSRS